MHYLEISRYLLGNFLRIITYSLASFNVCLANCKSWSQSTNIHTTILYLRGFHHLTRPFPLKPSCVLLQASYIISKAWVAQFFFFFFSRALHVRSFHGILWNYQLRVFAEIPICPEYLLINKNSYTGHYLWENSL